jgi:hypothetical protein
MANTLPDRLATEAANFIAANRDRPFFRVLFRFTTSTRR